MSTCVIEVLLKSYETAEIPFGQVAFGSKFIMADAGWSGIRGRRYGFRNEGNFDFDDRRWMFSDKTGKLV